MYTKRLVKIAARGWCPASWGASWTPRPSRLYTRWFLRNQGTEALCQVAWQHGGTWPVAHFNGVCLIGLAEWFPGKLSRMSMSTGVRRGKKHRTTISRYRMLERQVVGHTLIGSLWRYCRLSKHTLIRESWMLWEAVHTTAITYQCHHIPLISTEGKREVVQISSKPMYSSRHPKYNTLKWHKIIIKKTLVSEKTESSQHICGNKNYTLR